MNWFESELRKDIASEIEAGTIAIEPNSDWVFIQLQERFPIGYGRIDWKSVPNSVEQYKYEPEQKKDAFFQFFEHISGRYELVGDVIYVGENIDIGLRGEIVSLNKILPQVFEFNQHHFITDCLSDWCMSFSMEGEMGFGFAPKNS